MNRRTQGRVKQARKRLQKRIDIRAGRRMSMQQYMHNTHNHVEEETVPQGWDETATGEVDTMPEEEAMPIPGDPNGTHQVIANDNGTVMGQGSESQMRKLRAECMREMPDASFSVRKVKVTV
jgi:hypothetical protein